MGRANIEESKSRVIQSTQRPRASYPRGNFSDTSAVAPTCRGSLGHAFARRTLAQCPAQVGFCPYALRQVSILAEPTFGRLRCSLVGVPPQPSISPDAVLSTAQPPPSDRGRPSRVGLSPPHDRSRSPLTPPRRRRRNVWLMQSSTGSSLPAILSKPVSLAVCSLGGRSGQWRSRYSIHAGHQSNDEESLP